MRRAAVMLPLVLLFGAGATPFVAAALEPPLAVTAIEPNHASPGAKIKLVGHGFRGTKKVLFVVGGFQCKEARFHTLSDAELQVEVPEYLTADLQAAILVETASGVTVTVPRDQLIPISSPTKTFQDRFVQVEAGGTADHGGSSVTLIDRDGMVSAGRRLTLVAKGGRVDGASATRDRSANLIFAEPGATVGMKAHTFALVKQVPHVSGSPVDELFTYDAIDDELQPPDDPAQLRAPYISALKPAEGIGGDIIEIHGTGFTGTRSVEFIGGIATSRTAAAFRALSDRVLRAEVPVLQVISSPFMPPEDIYVVVESARGVAFTMPRGIRPLTVPNVRAGGVMWLGKGGSYTGHSGPQVLLVDDGGLAVRSGGRVCFVKDGGTLVDSSAPNPTWCEPNARLNAAVQGQIINVPKINACPVDSCFHGPRGTGPFGPRP
jgi:hypothetical protein